MTPGIQPSKVKIILRKKLAIRPVISTTSGGKTTQKKYRSAFIKESSSSSESSSSLLRYFLLRRSAIRSLRSPDSTIDRDKAGAAAIQARHFVLRFRSPCTCRFARCALPAFRGAALRHERHFPADPAPQLLA